jgi:hypothetical protein
VIGTSLVRNGTLCKRATSPSVTITSTSSPRFHQLVRHFGGLSVIILLSRISNLFFTASVSCLTSVRRQIG